MAVIPNIGPWNSLLSGRLMGWSRWLNGFTPKSAVSGDYSLDTVPMIDERLRARAPMPVDSIDIMTRMQLSSMGLRNAKQVTAETHPELFSAWISLCQRAGFGAKPPQLIIVESRIANAMEFEGNMMVTTGMLEMLDLREVVAVLGHEVGHGRHEHTMVRKSAATAFGAMGALTGDHIGRMGGIDQPLANLAEKTFGKWGNAGRHLKNFFMPVLMPQGKVQPTSLLGYMFYIFMGVQVGSIAAAQISVKPTELQADLDGVAISGDGAALISGLEKLQAADSRGPIARAWGYLRSGYPSMKTRYANIQRAMQDIPFNPVPVLRDHPSPVAAIQPQQPQMTVNTVAHADRVAVQALPEQAL